MSFASSLNSVRLQELKLWQGSYENLLQNSKRKYKEAEEKSEAGAEEMTSTPNRTKCGLEKTHSNTWDKKKIPPCKPFDQLLEEKLAEDRPLEVTNKPKQPFLKKGQGLIRYKMKSITTNLISHSERDSHRKSRGKTIHDQQVPIPPIKKGILKKFQIEYNPEIDLTPLTVPDFVKPRGTWKNVFENAGLESDEEEPMENVDRDTKYENFKRRLSLSGETNEGVNLLEITNESLNSKASGQQQQIQSSYLSSLHKEIVEEIKSYAARNFRVENRIISNDIPENISETVHMQLPLQCGEDTFEEQKSARELRAFEILEKKVENSSFCSTNTSIVNLLKASTPRKLIEMRHAPTESGDSLIVIHDKNENHQLKLTDIMQKTDILKQFLINLHKLDNDSSASNQLTTCTDATGDSSTQNLFEKNDSMISSICEEEEATRWSTRTPSLVGSDQSSAPSEKWEKNDVGVNTSFANSYDLDDTIKDTRSCQKCEELRSKLSGKIKDFNQLKSSNAKIKSELKDLEEKYNNFKKDRKNTEQKYKAQIEELRDELENEQKKLAKEKTYFETYIKNAENRPTKKEREEINQLKQEVANCKEFIKLKDTKYGATQARLRTQIKQYEKECVELKITVEKLQKENAKLSANQKYIRRPGEMKMLKEINKHLSKLTDESMRNLRQSRSDPDPDGDSNADDDEFDKKISNPSCNARENDGKKSVKKTHESETKVSISDSSKSEISTNIDFENVDNIEKRYENVFSGLPSPKNNNSHSNMSDKTERTLADGTIEVTYSNGNFKTVSPDGQVIKIKYFNGDTKETNLIEKVIRYHYAATDAWHIQYPDGSEILEYTDGQKCTKHNNGTTEIFYPDGSWQMINIDGSQEHHFPDGRKTLKQPSGEQTIFLPNGQKEIHTKSYKRREYPDGTRRTLYDDGSVETVYSNGRVRLKDSNGQLVMDTHPE